MLRCCGLEREMRPFEPPLPERDLPGGQPPPLPPHPRGLRLVDGGWLWRSTGDDSGDGLNLRYPRNPKAHSLGTEGLNPRYPRIVPWVLKDCALGLCPLASAGSAPTICQAVGGVWAASGG